MRKLAMTAVVVLAMGCDGGKGGTGKDAAVHDSTPSIDAPHIDAPMAIDAPAGTFQLTVKNYLNWCSVSVNGQPESTAGVQMMFVLPGTIPLTAKAASAAFKIAPNMWHHTTGDTGTGETGTITGTGTAAQSAVTATVGSADKCVWICCPFTNGTGCEPATVPDQCP